MVIKINYTSSDVYVSTSVSPVYVVVNYSAVNNGGGAVWGGITGTLSDQTDLQNALDAKFDDPTGTTSQYLRGDGSLATFPSLTGYVPYTGATSNVNLGEFGLTAGQLTLDTSPTGTAAVGTTRWNDSIGSSETTLKGGSVILKNGVDLVARIVNKVTPNTTLTKAAYQAVRVSGAQGQRLAVAFAQANNDANSADTIGLVTETIATNQEGFIICVGQIENINTTGSLQGETWADGDVLYLSPTTPGAITKVKPTGAGHIVVIGYVEYAHANNGKIYVKVMNGWELDELHDVSIVSPANNEALIYESSSQLWKNKTIASALGYTPISGTGATGQVAYWNGTNSQTGSNNLFWDAANSRLGIGTNAPSTTLTVAGGITLSSGSLSLPVAIHSVFGGAYRFWNRGSSRWTFEANNANIGFEFKHIMTSGNAFHIVNTSDTSQFLVSGAGNTILGSTTDGGQRLQVQGDAFIRGSGATSATTALTIQNSAGSNAFRVRNDGTLLFGNDSLNAWIFPYTTYDNVDFAGRNLAIYPQQGTISLGGGTQLQTSGNQSGVIVRGRFQPTSGTANFADLRIETLINQTGGANGISRGILISPNFTVGSGAADWRSIEWSNNSGWGLYGAGTANNYLGGSLGIGSASLSNANLAIEKNISGSTSSYGVLLNSVIQSGVTANAYGFRSILTTQAASFTLSNIYHFVASQTTQGAGSIVTTQIGYECGDMNNGYTNISYRGQISQGTLSWNLYMNGTASNYLAGQLLLGTTTKGTFLLDVNGTARVSGATTLSGAVAINSTNVSTGYALFVNGVIGAGILTLTDELTVGENFAIKNNGSQTIDIDANNNSTNAIFRVTCNGTNNELFRVNESGNFMLGTGTEIASAKLVVTSSTQGFLPPRMTTTQKNAISTPAAGLQVYDTTLNQMSYYNGTTWINF